MSGVDPLLLALANVASLAFWGILLWMLVRHLTRADREARGREADALRASLAALEADRDRLTARTEAIEAIVTSEGFDLDRSAREAGLLDALGATLAEGRRPAGRARDRV
ncbi:hypothetical protein [Rubrivirga marina]|uniref:Uncharacterized protein n=1 Tax=Rubrivirga marina TaxID=1196024 RepID=A0A271IWI1_9BACT|nr:hypothetical protein [Rubrivirga marina]PAP75586.1 hypothetical protein BSZ37_03615 [Rubrivirga marina]